MTARTPLLLAPSDTWRDANQAFLVAALADVRAALKRHAAASGSDDACEEEPSALSHAEAAWPLPGEQPALRVLCDAFNLSPFERDVLLLCAGVELAPDFAGLCRDATGQPAPTLGMALAALPGAHWDALDPAAPLRLWRLIEIEARTNGGAPLTQAPLRIDERILHFLAGTGDIDARLADWISPVAHYHFCLPPSQQTVAERIAAAWPGDEKPVLSLCGSAESGEKRAVAFAACQTLGLNLHALRAGDLPASAPERAAFVRLWEREVRLGVGGALLIAAEETDADGARALSAFVERTQGGVPFLVTAREPLLFGDVAGRAVVRLDVDKPTSREQNDLWETALGPQSAHSLNGQLAPLVAQFHLSAPAIESAARLAAPGDEQKLAGRLWDACRAQARPRLGSLAQRITTNADWDDLILPPAQKQTLREIVLHVAQRARVYEEWGFGASGSGARGLGISALFHGPSGTGKTLAAEVLAAHLRLDLYRIDLSSVVSKYIGETEKNLARVFDAAEEGGAVLLFDEADALFGKRSEVKDSHDRYANIEVSYLLQRMETYRGLAILTTNLKDAMDTAFLRRLRFVVAFPFPDAVQRAQIWRRVFPSDTPRQNLDCDKLARLSVAGGNIRNIALGAAFLAAGDDTLVTMTHLLRAARAEHVKIEKPLGESETAGWVEKGAAPR